MNKIIKRKCDKFVYLVGSNILTTMTVAMGGVGMINNLSQGVFSWSKEGAFIPLMVLAATYLYKQYNSPIVKVSDWIDSIHEKYLDNNKKIDFEDKHKILAQYMFIHAQTSASKWSTMMIFSERVGYRLERIIELFNNHTKTLPETKFSPITPQRDKENSKHYVHYEQMNSIIQYNKINFTKEIREYTEQINQEYAKMTNLINETNTIDNQVNFKEGHIFKPERTKNIFDKLMLNANQYLMDKAQLKDYNDILNKDFENYPLFKAALEEHFDTSLINAELATLMQETTIDKIFEKIHYTGHNKEQAQYINLYLLEQFLCTPRVITDKQLSKCFKYLFKNQPFSTTATVHETERNDLFNIISFIGEHIHKDTQINYSIIEKQLNAKNLDGDKKEYLQKFFTKKDSIFSTYHTNRHLRDINSLLNIDFAAEIIEKLLFIESKFEHFDKAQIEDLDYVIKTIFDCKKKIKLVQSLSPEAREASEQEIRNTLIEVNKFLSHHKSNIEHIILKEIRVNNNVMKKMNAAK